jgi:hypothetical protein
MAIIGNRSDHGFAYPHFWPDTASIDQSPVISAKLEKPILNKIGRTMRAGRVELVAAIEGIILLVAALFLLKLRDDEESRFFGLLLGVPVLMNLKRGFVRQDTPHIIVVFCFLALALALINARHPTKPAVHECWHSDCTAFVCDPLARSCRQ